MHVLESQHGSKEQEDGTFHINSKLLLDGLVNTIKDGQEFQHGLDR